MTAKSITVLGSINVDLVIKGERLPTPGETVTDGQFFKASGGKGANKAVAAARLAGDQPVRLIGAVGDDAFGHEVLAQLRDESLDIEQVCVLADAATGIALIMVDDAGQNMISVASGANAALRVPAINALPSTAFAGVFVTNLELSLCTVARGLKRARGAGAVTILNPAPAHPQLLENNVLKLVDVLTPNEVETAMLTGLPVTTADEAAAAARRLCKMGPSGCVITRGAEGCTVLDTSSDDTTELAGAENVTHIEAERVEAVDATAAGDAFNGALAVALSEGRSLIEAARWATRAASISVTQCGAQPSLPRREALIAP